ncbi:MAG: anaerobic ribonucleoside-triphosphate reductase activating protein [Anaerolineaceae bacterium]|nr:anaerobic ribonucleoside-triphosphate reductase activating protein [Anaerolineaceae bacterium]
MKIRLAGIAKESVTDGPGLRIVLFFQGCAHFCEGCHNPQTWPMQGGDEYDVNELINSLPDSPLIRGVTLSGGDPFYQAEAALAVATEFKGRNKDVWAYTGFTWEQLMAADETRRELVRASDVLVDGPFVRSLMDPSQPFRGSTNQRLISVSESLQEGKIIEWQRL